MTRRSRMQQKLTTPARKHRRRRHKPASKRQRKYLEHIKPRKALDAIFGRQG